MHWKSRNHFHRSNKITSKKSLHLNFLVHKTTYGEDPHILNYRNEKEKLMNNIKEELQTVKATIKPNGNLRIATFEYKNDITGLKMFHRINILDLIENQDVFSWVLTLRDIKTLQLVPRSPNRCPQAHHKY
ncbi:hypothetical protein DMUE_3908 [Dictyocoela muelleri]|nr:hypothetical protein DMUE_3908 [Dictyocoela muelleri]